MAPNVYDQYTQLLRTSRLSLWVRLRRQLKSQGVNPSTAVLVNLFPDGGDHEYGWVISDEGSVFSFDLYYNRASRHGPSSAEIRHWKDITDNWLNQPFSDETKDALIWSLGEATHAPAARRARPLPRRHDQPDTNR